MTSAEIEVSASIVEAELRKIREAFDMREVTAACGQHGPYWYLVGSDGSSALKDSPGECIGLVLIKQRQAGK